MVGISVVSTPVIYGEWMSRVMKLQLKMGILSEADSDGLTLDQIYQFQFIFQFLFH